MCMSKSKMPVGEEKERDVSKRLREKRDRIVEEAVEKAARRMDADEHEREVLEEAAESLAEHITRPVVESAGPEEAEAVKRLFLDR